MQSTSNKSSWDSRSGGDSRDKFGEKQTRGFRKWFAAPLSPDTIFNQICPLPLSFFLSLCVSRHACVLSSSTVVYNDLLERLDQITSPAFFLHLQTFLRMKNGLYKPFGANNGEIIILPASVDVSIDFSNCILETPFVKEPCKRSTNKFVLHKKSCFLMWVLMCVRCVPYEWPDQVSEWRWKVDWFSRQSSRRKQWTLHTSLLWVSPSLQMTRYLLLRQKLIFQVILHSLHLTHKREARTDVWETVRRRGGGRTCKLVSSKIRHPLSLFSKLICLLSCEFTFSVNGTLDCYILHERLTNQRGFTASRGGGGGKCNPVHSTPERDKVSVTEVYFIKSHFTTSRALDDTWLFIYRSGECKHWRDVMQWMRKENACVCILPLACDVPPTHTCTYAVTWVSSSLMREEKNEAIFKWSPCAHETASSNKSTADLVKHMITCMSHWAPFN